MKSATSLCSEHLQSQSQYAYASSFSPLVSLQGNVSDFPDHFRSLVEASPDLLHWGNRPSTKQSSTSLRHPPNRSFCAKNTVTQNIFFLPYGPFFYPRRRAMSPKPISKHSLYESRPSILLPINTATSALLASCSLGNQWELRALRSLSLISTICSSWSPSLLRHPLAKL